MSHVLHIDSSPRGDRSSSGQATSIELLHGSHSRRLTKEFVCAWQQAHLADVVTYRDIGRYPIPHVNESWIAAAYVPLEQRTPQAKEAIDISDRLIDEFLAADLYVMSVPVYNFSVPSTFKAYIDQIVRPGRTFVLEKATNSYRPLVLGKKMFIIAARGASDYGVGDRYEQMNHHDPYLRTIFGFICITNITFIYVENDDLGGTSLAQSIAKAQSQIEQMVGG